MVLYLTRTTVGRIVVRHLKGELEGPFCNGIIVDVVANQSHHQQTLVLTVNLDDNFTAQMYDHPC